MAMQTQLSQPIPHPVDEKALSFIAHELKAAHLAARCILEYLREENPDLPASIASYLSLVEGQIQRANKIADDILTTPLEGIHLKTERVNLKSLLEGINSLCQKVVPKQRNLKFELKCAQDVYGLWDPIRLEEAFLNLYCNSVKYAKPGGGLICVRVICDPQKCEAKVQMSDEGIGIPEESLSRIFEARYRAPNAQLAWIDGHGIGLCLTQDIVVRHGGKIEVDSQINQGATFTVTLPLPTDTALEPARQ